MNDDLFKAKILSCDRAVPRYTSYPAATHFQENFLSKQYESWLTALPENTTISLYLHIPFCSQLCFYCGCHTKITQRYAPIATYLYLLKSEAEKISFLIPKSCRVTHVHLGGGSPTILSPDDFRDVIKTLQNLFSFDPACVIGVEADPRQLSAEKIKVYAESGVRRMSLGVQDFHQPTMVAINRAQPFALTRQSVDWMRAYGIGGINFDLMYGLPGQSPESIRDTMQQAISLAPSRISFFGYAHVPWIKKHMRLMPTDLPDASLRYDLAAAGAEMLMDHGYYAIGIDHFVRPEDEMIQAWKNKTLKRNFQGYTVDDADALIGLGVSSISKLPQGYVQNTPHQLYYQQALADTRLPVSRGWAMDDQDRMHAEIIEALMCYLEVDLSDISRRWQVPVGYFDPMMHSLQDLCAQGLLAFQDYRIIVHPQARQIVRVVCAAFDDYAMLARHSQAV